MFNATIPKNGDYNYKLSMEEAGDQKLADYIRGKRGEKVEITEEMFAHARDLFEKAGAREVTYPAYTKFAVIDVPAQNTKNEMDFIMQGYYQGKISRDEIRGFFQEYAARCKYGTKLENIYESFLDASYSMAVKACFDEGKEIAAKEGIDSHHAVYYNADYYYRAEEMHEFLKELTQESAEKYGREVDIGKKEAEFQSNPNYLTGYPNFNSKWNFMAHNVCGGVRMVDFDTVPPKGFSFLYRYGSGQMMIGGSDWSEKIDLSSHSRGAKQYPRLSELFSVDSKREENWTQYHDFMKNFAVARW